MYPALGWPMLQAPLSTLMLNKCVRLPPIRTALKVKSRNEKRGVPVKLQVGLTEIGTIALSCHQVDDDRSWKLQFDVRSATQTDRTSHSGAGESEGFIDEETWQTPAKQRLRRCLTPDGNEKPKYDRQRNNHRSD